MCRLGQEGLWSRRHELGSQGHKFYLGESPEKQNPRKEEKPKEEKPKASPHLLTDRSRNNV